MEIAAVTEVDMTSASVAMVFLPGFALFALVLAAAERSKGLAAFAAMGLAAFLFIGAQAHPLLAIGLSVVLFSLAFPMLIGSDAHKIVGAILFFEIVARYLANLVWPWPANFAQFDIVAASFDFLTFVLMVFAAHRFRLLWIHAIAALYLIELTGHALMLAVSSTPPVIYETYRTAPTPMILVLLIGTAIYYRASLRWPQLRKPIIPKCAEDDSLRGIPKGPEI
ncbi:hypothetical protein [Croceicoccus gelatinilyticus]|uniref:hypothetical protein n=1 Tax=Croceicoccus gelatinilyticus TaxID=2835536 RepID=UPI001BCE97D1|nr:hypothetical protein [Croceicoccus gelatinilyticus]MBS7671798.1 hypothetical protein [Croceicoccus gelatinilyticus]